MTAADGVTARTSGTGRRGVKARRRPGRMRRFGVAGAAALAAAVGAALAAGVPARICMRLVAVASGQPAHFSWVGTTGILLIFAAAMLPGALVAAGTTGRLRWLGVAAGEALLDVPAIGVARTEVGPTAGFSTGTWVAVVAAALGVFACIAALPVIAFRLAVRVRARLAWLAVDR